MGSATAQAFANIAFIKYWGNRDNALRLPANGSISMNLDGLHTRTTVSFQRSLPYDELIINGREIAGPALERVSCVLDLVRELARSDQQAEVVSENNFPSGAGIASSAAAPVPPVVPSPVDSSSGSQAPTMPIPTPPPLPPLTTGRWSIASRLSAIPTRRPARPRAMLSRRPALCR